MKNFVDLLDLVLKQLKECIPPDVATHIAERGAKTVSEAATLVDEYASAHQGTFEKSCASDNSATKAVGLSFN